LQAIFAIIWINAILEATLQEKLRLPDAEEAVFKKKEKTAGLF